ncbi:hypothetical protein PRVXT_000252 [Proteinivorax tanatarense]|uniref:Apea-like HEPN domain-containing protein n=1 Tax=Proteinivorax tanatarense TaxID=1260629 RepID=A0AAU7VLY5_9FIRM
MNEEHTHFRKLTHPSLKMVLDETLHSVRLFKKRVLYSYHIESVVKELIDTIVRYKHLYLTRDMEMLKFWLMDFIKEWKQLRDEEFESRKIRKVEEVERIIQVFNNKLGRKPTIDWHVDGLQELLNNEKTRYSQVDESLELLVSELLHMGHSKKHLYSWGAGVFIYEQDSDFESRLLRIKDLGKHNKREFECCLKLSLPSHKDYNFLNSNSEESIINFKNNSYLKEKIEEYTLEENKINDFLSEEEGLSFAIVKVEALDNCAAASRARELLESRVKLFRLDKKLQTYNESIKKEVMVIDISGKRVNLLPILPEEPKLVVDNVNNYIQLLITQESEYSSEIIRLLEWIRVVQESPKETAFIAIWSLLEFLFNHDSFTGKRQSVIDYSIPIIGSSYAKKSLNRTLQRLKVGRENGILFKKMNSQIEDSFEVRRKKIKKHVYLAFFNDKGDKAASFYTGKVIETRYIRLMSQMLQVKKVGKKRCVFLLDSIERVEKQVENDLSRIYRVRNMLTHEAKVPIYLMEEVYEKMVFYCKILLEDILYTWFQERCSSLSQVVTIKRKSYIEYKKNLQKISSKQIENTDVKQCCEEILYGCQYLF